jgi:hypothetical protein
MAPRKHYSKSQEWVYKQVGTGPRARFKLVQEDLPLPVGTSARGAVADEIPRAPPIVTAPVPVEDMPTGADHHDFAEGDEVRPKKTGKVCAL